MVITLRNQKFHLIYSCHSRLIKMEDVEGWSKASKLIKAWLANTDTSVAVERYINNNLAKLSWMATFSSEQKPEFSETAPKNLKL